MVHLIACALFLQAASDSRLPIPSPDTQMESEKVIRDIFKDERASDGNWAIEVETQCANKGEYLLTVLVENGEYVVQIDGEEKLRFKTPTTTVWHVALEANRGPVVFDKVQLRYAE